MNNFKAIVLCHYNFENSKGRTFQGTKFLVDLGNYGSVIANGPYKPDLVAFSEVDVILTYDSFKFKITEVY